MSDSNSAWNNLVKEFPKQKRKKTEKKERYGYPLERS